VPIATAHPICRSAPLRTIPAPLARGSQGRADADLAGALGHNVCRNAIRPQAGERQCQQAEDPSEPRDEPLARKISLQLLAEKTHPQHAEVRIDFVSS
jgi:hypothetical protein